LPILKIDKYGMFQKGSDKSYDLSVRKTDERISRVFDLLSKKNILNETLIIITADHGHDAGFPNRNVGIGSASFYDEFIHIPLIFYNPQISPISIDSLCSSIDIVPTLLSLVGIDSPDSFKGYPVFSEDVKEREYVISEHTHRGPCDLERKPLYISIRTKEYKLIWKEYIYNRDNSNQQFELYDLIQDPFEKNNVYSDSRYSTVQEWLMNKVKERYKILKGSTNIGI
jgi:arylsulfatase A-like enzyme